MASKTAIKKPKHSKLYYVIIAICMVLLSTYITLRIIDGLRFKNIKQDIATLGQEIQNAAPATKHKTVLYCDYANMKYARGSRSCKARSYAYYEGDSRVVAETKYDKIIEIIGRKYSLSSIEPDVYRPADLSSYSFATRGLYCSVNAQHYPVSAESPHSFKNLFGIGLNTTIQGLVVSVGCSGSAMADYYPVDE